MASAAQKNRQLPKPVDFDQLYPGRFLKSGELLGKKRTVTIDHVEIDELENEKGKKIQGVIILQETEKQIVLNKTNGLCLRGMFGRRLSDWEGKRITIFQDQVRFGGDTVDAIRIWGSPDIARDMDVIINLPRKKPFTMKMHKVVTSSDQQARSQSNEATDQQRTAVTAEAPKRVEADLVGEPLTEQTALARIRDSQSIEEVEAIMEQAQRVFGDDFPLTVDMAANDRKEALTQL